MNYDEYKRKTCRYCETPLGTAFLDLGAQPLANNLPGIENARKPEFRCPLALVKCPECHLVQLTHSVPANLMFDEYLYVSSTTQTFRTHFAEYARDVRERIGQKPGALAVDIGSNDGLLVSSYEKEGLRGVGVEPQRISRPTRTPARYDLNRYFGEEAVAEIIARYGRPTRSAEQCLRSIDDIRSVLRTSGSYLRMTGSSSSSSRTS